MAKGPVVCIEGIIGAGKTTLCDEACRRVNMRLVEEPVEDNPYLELYYENPKRYGLPMQMWLATRRFRLQSEAASEITGGFTGTIVDRSILGDRAFALALLGMDLIEEEFWPVYDEFFQAMAAHVRPPTLMIYLDVTPNVALQRIQKRSRDFEKKSINLQYLVDLRKAYEKMIDEVSSQKYPWCKGISVFKFGWNTDNAPTAAILKAIEDHCTSYNPN